MVGMGFPDWTLWGMGISAVTALVSLALALLGQSPQLLRQSGLGGARLDLRVRTLTAVAFACLLLAFGFFVAGVPIGDQTLATATIQADATSPTVVPTTSREFSDDAIGDEADTLLTITPATPATGAFDGPPVRTSEAQQEPTEEGGEPLIPEEEEDPLPKDTVPGPPSTAVTPTSSPVASSTPTASPTITPTPSLTPTPILGDTIQVETSGSTVWLRRSPGGQNLVLVQDGDFVIILSGHANQGGILWRELLTLNGETGWLQQEFLLLGD